MQCLRTVLEEIMKVISETFLKLLFERGTKEQYSALFVERPVHNLLSAKIWEKCNF